MITICPESKDLILKEYSPHSYTTFRRNVRVMQSDGVIQRMGVMSDKQRTKYLQFVNWVANEAIKHRADIEFNLTAKNFNNMFSWYKMVRAGAPVTESDISSYDYAIGNFLQVIEIGKVSSTFKGETPNTLGRVRLLHIRGIPYEYDPTVGTLHMSIRDSKTLTDITDMPNSKFFRLLKYKVQ